MVFVNRVKSFANLVRRFALVAETFQMSIATSAEVACDSESISHVLPNFILQLHNVMVLLIWKQNIPYTFLIDKTLSEMFLCSVPVYE